MDNIPTQTPRIMASWSATFFTRLHRYKMLLARRWWILVLTVAAGVSIQSYNVSKQEEVWTSSAKMSVKPRFKIKDTTYYQENVRTFLGDQLEIMEGGRVRQRAVDRVLSRNPDLQPTGVDFKAYLERNTSTFFLTATSNNKKYTQLFLAAVMDEFIRYKEEDRMEASEQYASALREQLIKLEKELNDVQMELHNFRRTNNIIMLEEEGNAAAKYLVSLREKKATLERELKLLELLTLDQALGREEALVADKNPDAEEDGESSNSGRAILDKGPQSEYLRVKKEIQILQSEVKELSVVLRPRHPKMIRLNEEISRQEKLLAIYRDQSLEQIKIRREAIKLELQTLSAQIKEHEEKAHLANNLMVDYQRLDENETRVKEERDRLFDTLRSIERTAEVNQPIIDKLDPASVPTSKRIGWQASLLNGALAGFVIGCGILFLLDRIDDRINSFTELKEHFDEQVLGQIPFETPSANSRVALLTADDARQVYAEAYRNIRSSLMYMVMSGERPRTLLITSAIPSEGKSTVASNLAVTLAFSGSNVLLIDADLRKGLLHDVFEKPVAPGLSEVLQGQLAWTDALQATPYGNMHFIPRGRSLRHAGELMLSAGMDHLLFEAKNAYDYVIVDSPPVLAADDTASLAPKVDGTLVVMRSGFTSARLTTSALESLYQRQVNVLGIVFNFINTNLPDYYHYQYYKYYYTSS